MMETHRTPLAIAASIALLASAGCDGPDRATSSAAPSLDRGGARGAPSGQSTASAPSMLVSFNPFAGQLPESITSDARGDLYVSMSGLGEIWKVSPEGTFLGVVAGFPVTPGDFGVIGVRTSPRGDLYAGVESSVPGVQGVWRVGADGASERIAGTEQIGIPNDVAVHPDGTLYITDSALGAVWRVERGGSAEPWVQSALLEGTGAFGLPSPIGANGIVVIDGRRGPFGDRLSPATRGAVLVANSEKGMLVQVPIGQDGSSGVPTAIVQDPGALFGLDGIQVDRQGVVYGAVNVQGRIVRIGMDGVETLAAGPPLDFPSDLTFGGGRDNATLFITNFALIHFLSSPPAPQNAAPGIVRLDLAGRGR